MAKQKTQQSIARQGNNQIIQTSYEEDDNMMPAPEVLMHYQSIDPTFIEWFKKRSDVEQNARIKFNDDRIKLAKSTNNKLFTIDLTTIVVSAAVMSLGLFLSYYLIAQKHEKIGAFIGAGTLLTYTLRLLNFRRNREKDKK